MTPNRRFGRAAIPRLIPLAFCLALAAVLFGLGGCGGGGEKTAVRQPAASDTTAYRAAVSTTDSTARVAALEAFLKDYPTSPFRPGAVSQAFGVLMKKDPARAATMVAGLLKKETDPDTRSRLHYCTYIHAREKNPPAVPAALRAMMEDPVVTADAFNSVAWDLVTRGEQLDEAIRMAALGAERATDDESKASILDTQGWGHYVKGEYPQAVEVLEKAAGMVPKEDAGEMRGHLAMAYDKAGKKREARDLMVELMTAMEDPEMRSGIDRLTKELGEDPTAIFAHIDQTRESNATAASDFTLKDYDGKPVSLADFKGKVVLLNFWHPT
jgi:hypothetical protein